MLFFLNPSFNPFIQVFYFYIQSNLFTNWKSRCSFNPFIQVFYFYTLESWRNSVSGAWVLIPLFRSFIFTRGVWVQIPSSVIFCFNPFIQVFYFYGSYRWEWFWNCNEKVLIPLFRSFIFTEVILSLNFFIVFIRFNPFIQVFYFYLIT